MPAFSGLKKRAGALIILMVLAALPACRPSPEPAAGLAAASPRAASVTASPAPPVPSPPASPTPVNAPSFALVAVPPTVTPKQEAGMEAKAPATATAEPSPTATPQPTFTPPALPFTSPNEHYWLRRPVAEGGTVWTDKSYPYGSTRGGTLRPHHGVEFYVPAGTELLAAASGTVVVAGNDAEIVYGPHANFYGNLIVIELDTRFGGLPVYTLYGHLSQPLVNVGQHVEAEEIIALSGATGVADGAHLHFEVRVGQNDYRATRNPLLWLYPFPEHGAVAGRVQWPTGELVHGLQVFLRRVDAPSKYAATTSYTNQSGELNADEGWGENFAFDDVVAGYYEVEVRNGTKRFVEEVWVYPYRTSFVEITMAEATAVTAD